MATRTTMSPTAEVSPPIARLRGYGAYQQPRWNIEAGPIGPVDITGTTARSISGAHGKCRKAADHIIREHNDREGGESSESGLGLTPAIIEQVARASLRRAHRTVLRMTRSAFAWTIEVRMANATTGTEA
ncbi:MAG TPA: hypothetical protein VFB89_04895, partial [Gemmatimonadales bacterium]|nr:hypothetical protein [Gemmatimonadales bacterium]